MRRSCFLRNSIAIVCVIVSLSCLLVLSISVFRLPEVSTRNNIMGSSNKSRKVREIESFGKFGEMMVEMLPEDLAFTIFIPSEKAFERDLRFREDESLVGEKVNDTYAVLTRLLGFSAVPRMIHSGSIPNGKEISYDSLSGYSLFMSRDLDGMVVVNGVRSEVVDRRKGKIVVHIMDGVIMEADFEQSVRPDYDEEG
ncbi:hypothetical protein RJ640_023357 [Escallonia rubra]|uniref:FAS1 domain-containing protein n=1 Tax=Escallonia rubra TaxID=112253 RepID=A0AA88UPU5_9ASTE|nr:hypothetical protein RJ640_023357 [Escallonia rubra]